jgi:hypothetical protein
MMLKMMWSLLSAATPTASNDRYIPSRMQQLPGDDPKYKALSKQGFDGRSNSEQRM